MNDNTMIANLQRNMDFFASDWKIKKEVSDYEAYGFYSDYWSELPDVLISENGSMKVITSSDDFSLDMNELRGLTECSMLLNRNYYLND